MLTDPIAGAIAATIRPPLRGVREGLARADLARRSVGQGPLVVFLPAGPADGAALLRIYNMADALRPLGWRTAVLPWKLTLHQRWRYLAVARPDLVVMQGARHALNRPALYPDWPIVYDMDDADFHLDHLKRPVTEAMGQVAGVIAGSRYIADWARAQGAARADVIWTGTPASDRVPPPQDGRPPVVAWAQTRPMTYRREAARVAGVMSQVAQACPGVTLRLYDRRASDDAGFVDMFRTPGLRVEWRPAQSYAAFLAGFDDVAVGLAPLSPETPFSRGKSFGKVLAYLQAGVPVVGSDAGEHGAFFDPTTGLISNEEGAWVQALVRLLGDPPLRQAYAEAAGRRFEARLSVSAAARDTADVLAAHLAARPHAWPLRA